jgi:hypothetical protein
MMKNFYEGQFQTLETLRGCRPNNNNESVFLQQDFTLSFKRQKD